MSKNGRGKLLSGIRQGAKPALDERNQLIVDAVQIAKRLNPRLILLENVPEMVDTLIDDPRGGLVNILDYLRRELPRYFLSAKVIEFADYGVPQRRQRLITVLTTETALIDWHQKHGTLFPPASHSRVASMFTKQWVSVNDAIGHLPSLDASTPERARSELDFHYVPLLDQEKYFWVSSTPPGKSAFDNQCANAKCGYQGNPIHSAVRANGINRASRKTPLYCMKCGSLLPRPWVVQRGKPKLMSGFTSAYKRMRADIPASALTRNLSYACSDQKLHPTQHRVLSLREALIIHTIDQFEYSWETSEGKRVADKTIREVIGESIPPAGLLTLCRHIFAMLDVSVDTDLEMTKRYAVVS